MVVGSGDCAPVSGRPPLIPGFVVGADQKARNIDFGIAARILEEPLHMGDDFADEGASSPQLTFRALRTSPSEKQIS